MVQIRHIGSHITPTNLRLHLLTIYIICIIMKKQQHFSAKIIINGKHTMATKFCSRRTTGQKINLSRPPILVIIGSLNIITLISMTCLVCIMGFPTLLGLYGIEDLETRKVQMQRPSITSCTHTMALLQRIHLAGSLTTDYIPQQLCISSLTTTIPHILDDLSFGP